MATKKYRVETDKGVFEVEVEEPNPADPHGSAGTTVYDDPALAQKEKLESGEIPSDFMGGFMKHITDSLTRNPAIKGAAQPEGLSDIMNLVIPSSVMEARVPFANAITEGKMGIKEAPRMRDVPGSVLRRIYNWAGKDAKAIQQERFNELPTAKQMDYLPDTKAPVPAREPAAPFASGPQTNINDLPLWKQQEMMEATGSKAVGESTRTGIPRMQPKAKPPTQVRPAQSKATTLEEELAGVVEEARTPNPTDARISSLPPEPSITEGGSFRQSGKFKKSESLGQPGGYSSGRPGVTQQGYDDVVESARPKELLEKLGGQQADPLAAELGGSGLDVANLTPEEWAELRRFYGADKLAEMTGKTREEILSLAPGPSRTPLEVEDRINQNPDGIFKYLP